jgi:Leucine-rich repeat (LRR) protein
MGKKPKIADPLAPVRTTPMKVTHLELNPAGSRNAGKGWFDPLPAFPDEILACKNLVMLEVFRGIRDGTIPPAIGTLKKLTHLGLGGLTTTELPKELGQLAKLEHLGLAYMESLTSLPASVSKLTKLVDIQAPYAGLTALPPIGTLKKLQLANFAHSKLATVDASLWDCAALEALYLPSTLTSLPRGIAKLKKLRELSLSPSALASIAAELPKLQLDELQVRGEDGALLPDELGAMVTLSHLDLGYLELTSLPSTITKLANLTALHLGGNKLSTLIDTVLAFPKLRTLDYSGNPIAVAERRELDKLMKLPPAKRKKPAVKAAPKPKAAKAMAKAKPKLTPIGQVASVNASLSMIIADAKVAKQWTGVGDDPDDSDWDRARAALAKKSYAMLDVGDHSAVALTLEVGQGIAHVFRIGERIVVVEAIADNTEDELFLEYVASAPQKPKSVANLTIPSKKLVFVPTTEPGDSDESLSIDVPAKISITIEPHTESSWGRARRFFVTPA